MLPDKGLLYINMTCWTRSKIKYYNGVLEDGRNSNLVLEHGKAIIKLHLNAELFGCHRYGHCRLDIGHGDMVVQD